MPKKCSFSTCDRNAVSKGYCDKHYRRILKHGTLETKRFISEGNDVERFLDKINKTDSCWLWVGGVRPNGKGTPYGRHHLQNGKSAGAHRFSYELFIGKIGDMLVCHKCDNPLCVNPDHLFLGTHEDNMRDMVEKCRSHRASGELHHISKLTNQQAQEIRQSTKSRASLARDYNVSLTTIFRIKSGETYKCTN